MIINMKNKYIKQRDNLQVNNPYLPFLTLYPDDLKNGTIFDSISSYLHEQVGPRLVCKLIKPGGQS